MEHINEILEHDYSKGPLVVNELGINIDDRDNSDGYYIHFDKLDRYCTIRVLKESGNPTVFEVVYDIGRWVQIGTLAEFNAIVPVIETLFAKDSEVRNVAKELDEAIEREEKKEAEILDLIDEIDRINDGNIAANEALKADYEGRIAMLEHQLNDSRRQYETLEATVSAAYVVAKNLKGGN